MMHVEDDERARAVDATQMPAAHCATGFGKRLGLNPHCKAFSIAGATPVPNKART